MEQQRRINGYATTKIARARAAAREVKNFWNVLHPTD